MSLKTKAEFLAYLQEAYDRSVPFGGNNAIFWHICDVKKMTEDQCRKHQMKLNAVGNSPAMRREVKRMAQEFMEKFPDA